MNDNLQARGGTSTNAFVPLLKEQSDKGLCSDKSAVRAEALTDTFSVHTNQVIPCSGKSLRFLSSECDPGLALWIDPSSQEGYFYVTLVSWGHESGEEFIHAEGPRSPIPKDEVWAACQRYEAEHLVKSGERTELASAPLCFNRWLYEGHELQHSNGQLHG